MSEDQTAAQATPEAAPQSTEVKADPGQAQPNANVEQAQPAPSPEGDAAVKTQDDLTLPEGSALDAKALEDVAAFAKQHGLSETQAKGLLARESQAVTAQASRQDERFKAQVASWVNEIKNDKELGGEQFDKNTATAKRFIDRFGSDDLKKALNDTGLGNHPALFRLCLEAGKAMADDKMIFSGSASAEEAESPAQILYGKKN